MTTVFFCGQEFDIKMMSITLPGEGCAEISITLSDGSVVEKELSVVTIVNPDGRSTSSKIVPRDVT